MSAGLYILDELDQPVEVADVIEWSKWRAEHPADDQVGDIRVSTVFLGLDHSFRSVLGGPPVLWETMVFGGPLDHEMDRYTSKAAAQRGHAAMLARVQAVL